jgi:hypothetical protein
MHPPHGRVYAPRYLATATVLWEKIALLPLAFVPVTRTLMNLERSVGMSW